MGLSDRQVFTSVLAVGSLLSLTPVPGINPIEALKDVIIWALEIVFEGLTGFAGWFVLNTIEQVLFFPPPTQLESLTDLYWGLTFPLFWALLSVVGATFFLMLQLFPTSDKADVNKFMQRTLIAVILLFAVGHGYGLVVEAVHLVAQELFPPQFQIAITMDTYEGMATAAFTGFAVIIFAIIASPKVILTYGMFLLMLGMRMVIIYTTYVLFPILIAFWITDIGPLQYGKMLAGFMFKASILLLLFGVLLSAILGVGGALAGDAPTAEELGGEREDMVLNSEMEESRLEGGILAGDNSNTGRFAGQGQDAITGAWVSVYTYFAAIWLCITLTSMILGGSISTGISKKMVTASKLPAAGKRMKQRMNSGGNGFGRAGGMNKGKAAGAGGAVGGAAGGSKPSSTSGSPGSEDATGSGTDAAPEPDTGDDPGPASLKDKFNHVTNDRVKNAKDKAKGKAEEGADKVAEKGSEAGDAVEGKMTDLGKSAGGAVGGEYGAAIGGAAGKVAGKAGNLGVTAAGYAPKAAMKGANLAKRGGQAYWSVFKQPDPQSSIGEMGRIARESPIGKPDSPSGGEDGAADVEDTDVSDFDSDDVDSESATDDTDTSEGNDSQPVSGGTEETKGNDSQPLSDDQSSSDDGSAEEADTEGVSGSGTPDDPVDRLYEESDPSNRDTNSPKVNEEAAESIAKDIDESYDHPDEKTVRDGVHDRVDQNLGDQVDASGAEHAVMNKYLDRTGRDDMRRAGKDYEWS